MAHGVSEVQQQAERGLGSQSGCFLVQVVMRREERRAAVLVDASFGLQGATLVQEASMATFACKMK